MRRYPAYKDSKTLWIGEIPAHWEKCRIGDVCNLVNGYPFDASLFSLDTGVPLVRIRDIMDVKTEVLFSGEIVKDALIGRQDILIGMDGDFNVALWQGEEALLNQRVCCLRPLVRVCRRYIYYLLPFSLKIINDLTYSTTVKHLSSPAVRKITIPLPSLAEQEAIISYLDDRLNTIESFISAKRNLIELLNEQKVAIINRAVTRGLDRKALTKDTGLNWLQRVPVYWEVKRNGALFSHRVQTGYPELPILSVSLNTGVTLDTDEGDRPKRLIEDRSLYKRAMQGDIAYNMMRMWQGAVGAVPADGLVSPAYVVARPREGVDSRYYAYLFRTQQYMNEVNRNSRGIVSDRNRLYWEDFKQMPSPYPPLDEQAAIVQHIETESARIDGTIERINREIELVTEYRTTLISDAVTGKIDVRSCDVG